jgi:hypothetical protein
MLRWNVEVDPDARWLSQKTLNMAILAMKISLFTKSKQHIKEQIQILDIYINCKCRARFKFLITFMFIPDRRVVQGIDIIG